MNVEVRNKRTQEKKILSLDEAKKLIKNKFHQGLLEIGQNVVAGGYEMRPLKDEKND